MFDPFLNQRLRRPATWTANLLKKTGISADLITVIGFFIGIGAILAVANGRFTIALILLIVNRLFDGLDGSLARVTQTSDAGGFLDITLDFIFYSGFILGFALFNPGEYGLYAALLIFSFIGTGSSFLAFAIMAEKNKIKSIKYPHKSLYYLGGITEGSETILFFIFICLFPSKFIPASIVFAALCWITSVFRIFFGYLSLK